MASSPMNRMAIVITNLPRTEICRRRTHSAKVFRALHVRREVERFHRLAHRFVGANVNI